MTNSNRILLIGADGQVGSELRRSLGVLGKVVAASLDGALGPRLDLTDRDALRSLIAETKPNAVVNAAAYTAVDMAESEPEVAAAVNAAAPALIAEELAATGTPIVHYSTDFVFDGTSGTPYRESDSPRPLSVYGQTKLDGEHALLDSDANALVLRTSWVYGLRGKNFLLTMLRLFHERDELGVVDDQIGTPTWARLLADVTAHLLGRTLSGNLDAEAIRGLYHVTGAGETSWYGFANAILEASGADCELKPIPTSDFPAPAKRPAYSVLDNSKLADTFGLSLPAWEQSLAQCLEDLTLRLPGRRNI